MSTQLVLQKQEALATEKFGRNGVVKELHVVAKSLPFVIEVGAIGIDLTQTGLEARLIYDYDQEEESERVVEAIKCQPLECRAHINSADSATVECRVKVLTSQHAGSYFRVRMQAIEKSTNTVFQLTSHAIKVISKANQARRPKLPPGQRQKVTSPVSSPVSPLSLVTPQSSDSVLETLQRLEAQNLMQQELLERLVGGKKRGHQVLEAKEDAFEESFRHLIRCYSQVATDERPTKVRRVLSQMSPTDHSHITEFVNHLSTETALNQEASGFPNIEQQLQLTDSQQQQQLEEMDQFYMDLLSSPTSLTP